MQYWLYRKQIKGIITMDIIYDEHYDELYGHTKQEIEEACEYVRNARTALQDSIRAVILITKSHGLKIDFRDIYEQLIAAYEDANELSHYYEISRDHLMGGNFYDDMIELQK